MIEEGYGVSKQNSRGSEKKNLEKGWGGSLSTGTPLAREVMESRTLIEQGDARLVEEAWTCYGIDSRYREKPLNFSRAERRSLIGAESLTFLGAQ